MSYLNRADGVEARTWLPSGDQDRKLTPPPPTRWSGTQLSEATSQTWNTQTLSEGRLIMRYSHRSHISCIVAKKAGCCLVPSLSCPSARPTKAEIRSGTRRWMWQESDLDETEPEHSQMKACRTRGRNVTKSQPNMSCKRTGDLNILLFMCNWRGSTWLRGSRDPRATPVNSFDRQQQGQRRTVASTAQLQRSSEGDALTWGLLRWERNESEELRLQKRAGEKFEINFH